MTARAAKVPMPRDFNLARSLPELLVAGVPVPVRIEWPLLQDLQFRTIGQSSSPWTVSENAAVDPGFFAFPSSLADEYELSGYIAHLSHKSLHDALVLRQRTSEISGIRNALITVFVRSANKAHLVARLRDDQGLLQECSATSRSSETWSLLRLNLEGPREIAGDLIFEVEAAGRTVTDVDVALGNSRKVEEAIIDLGTNLLANDLSKHWPHGAGVLAHSVEGSVCTGWRIINRGAPAAVYTRAVMHPTDNNLGIGIAAAEVARHLRVEAEFAVDVVAGQPLVLRFRAGIPPAVTQMLSHQVDAIPQFAVIDRIAVIRRVRVTTRESFEEREEVAAVFARKVPIARNRAIRIRSFRNGRSRRALS